MFAALRANVAETIFGGLAALFAIIAIVQTVSLDGFLWIDGARDKLETARTNLNECRAGRTADRAAYTQAQRDAAAKNQAEVQRIESEQQRITSNVEADLSARLERLRRELRAKGAAPPRPAESAAAGPAVPSAPGAAEAARVCVSPEQFLLGAEYEEKLDQWITLYEQQRGVKR